MKSALPKKGNLMEDQLSTAGVGFLGMLIIGIIAGWVAEKVTASDQQVLMILMFGPFLNFILN
jgi:fructose-specific phosphotransferase system IIC component